MFGLFIYILGCIAMYLWAKSMGAGSLMCLFLSIIFTPLAGLVYNILHLVGEHDAEEYLNK